MGGVNEITEEGYRQRVNEEGGGTRRGLSRMSDGENRYGMNETVANVFGRNGIFRRKSIVEFGDTSSAYKAYGSTTRFTHGTRVVVYVSRTYNFHWNGGEISNNRENSNGTK